MNDTLFHPVNEFFDLKNPILSNSTENDLFLKSCVWTSDRCHRVRLCKFNVKNKFYAESLVIYPDFFYEDSTALTLWTQAWQAAADYIYNTKNQES